MSDERRRVSDTEYRVTPVVGGVLMANAIVLLLLQAVLTAPVFVESVRFAPSLALERPWTFLSYMFAHGGIGQLAVTSLGLFLFGPGLELRLGGRGFLLYYLYCGVGAAIFSLGLGPLLSAPVPPFLGASGAVLGLVFAWGTLWPDREMRLFPLPVHLSARSLVIALATMAAFLGLVVNDGVAHLANLGGLLAGYLYFRIQGLRDNRMTREPRAVVRRPVMAPIPVRQGSPAAEIRPAISAAAPTAELSPDALDRVLDKISATGLKSLTPAERQFLDEIAKRKRNDPQ